MVNWCMRVFRALGNMLAAAARDPLWAFMCIVMAPFRMWKRVLGTLVIVITSAQPFRLC